VVDDGGVVLANDVDAEFLERGQGGGGEEGKRHTTMSSLLRG